MHTLAEMINIAQRQLENERVKIDPNHMRWLLEKSSLLCESFLQSLHKSNKIFLCDFFGRLLLPSPLEIN